MLIPTKTKSIKMGGGETRMLVTNLLDRSAWFCVEPLPDGVWETSYKPEQDSFVQKFWGKASRE